MSAPQSGEREIARGLAAALRPALFTDATRVMRIAARDVAQVLGLSGLDSALEVLDRFAGPSRPRDVSLLAARLDRLADAAEREGSWSPLRDADAEIADWAARLAGTDWAVMGGASETPAEATHAAVDVLGDLPLDSTAVLERARFSGAVAASLRAAVDWVGFDLANRVQVVVHDSALTLTAACGHEAGMGPAAAVLAAVEGSLAREADGRWTIRVPLHAERASFLLLRQGRLGFALPWHSVAKLRMLPAGSERSLAEPVLEPFTTVRATEGERPAALVALGLARAWVVADRIVWRISAQPAESDVAGPFGSPPMVVMLDNQERYWVADAAYLLRGVNVPEVAPPAARDRTRESAALAAPAAPAQEEFVTGEALSDAVAHAIDALRAERPGPISPPAMTSAPVTEVRYHVQTTIMDPSELAGPAQREVLPEAAVEAEAPAALPSAPPAPAAGQRPSEIAELHPARRALVADDSMVARIFLGRMLERRGYIVETVGSGAAMWEELRRGPWSLVCADFAMPDSHGKSHVERMLDWRAHCREPFTLVMLTRDDEEDMISRDAGVDLVFRKPFANDVLDQLIGSLD